MRRLALLNPRGEAWRSVFPLTLVLIAGIPIGCDSNSPVDVQRETPVDVRSGAIRGTVLIGGSPAGGARVTLTGAVTLTTTSRADGAFGFTEVPPGAYTLTAAAAGANCEPAGAAVEGGQTVAAQITCVHIHTGAITGIVSAGGEPLAGVRMWVRELGRRATTDANGAFAMAAVPPGDYTLAATKAYTSCESVVLTVEAEQTASVNIGCQQFGRLGITIRNHIFVGRVTISGPVEQVVERNTFFDGRTYSFDLPSGDYTVTTMGFPESPYVCEAAPAMVSVQVGRQDVTISHECRLRGPSGNDISGPWTFSMRDLVSRAGNCPEVESVGAGLIGFDTDTGTMTIGLRWIPDPFFPDFPDDTVRIIGPYDQAIGHYFGQGSRVEPGGGFSVRTTIEGVFKFDGHPFDWGIFLIFEGEMTRELLGAQAGAPICIERYEVIGSHH